MLEYVLREPDALALLLLVLLIGATVAVGVVAGRRRDARERKGRSPAARRSGATEDTAGPTESDGEALTTWPHLLRAELLAGLLALLLVTWWAILLEVPLGAPADPAVTPALAKAPWFFIGVQELLQYFDAWLAGAVLPLLMVFGLCALPYLDVSPEANGCYTLRRRPVALVVVAALIVMWLLPMVVGELLRGEHWALQPVWQQPPLSPDLPPPQPPPALATRLGLEGGAGQVLGAVTCLFPYLFMALTWPRLRRRFPESIGRMGRVRYGVAGFLVVSAVGVLVKVLLVATLDVRYLWVTPWFRI
jgi:hypothetical protein